MFVEGQVGARGESIRWQIGGGSISSERVATRDGFRVPASSAWAPDREFSRVANAVFHVHPRREYMSRIANYG